MIWVRFFLLASFIMVAPHLTMGFAVTLAMVHIALALVFFYLFSRLERRGY